jgi:hypothetical protein
LSQKPGPVHLISRKPACEPVETNVIIEKCVGLTYKEKKVKKDDDPNGLTTFIASLDYGSAVFTRKKIMRSQLKAQQRGSDIEVTDTPVTEQGYFVVVSDPRLGASRY